MNDGIPFIITFAQKIRLVALGYTAEQILTMTPAEAHQILKVDGQVAASAPSGVEVDPSKHSAPSAADTARLDSWMIELCLEARGGMREEQGAWRFGHSGGLILRQSGWYYDFTSGRGGRGALDLLAHLHGGDEAGREAARAWLSKHVGDGRLGRSQGGDEAEEPAPDDTERKAYVQGLWGHAQPLGLEAIQYLNGRGLDPVATQAEAQLRWLPNWRGDEGALVAAVTDDAGELVAIHVTCLTANGEKSTIEPVRVTLRGPHDWRARGAFRLGSPEAEELTQVEGVADAIAAMMAGAERVHACLGVGALGRAQLPGNVTRTIVCRDDDTPGSDACKALGRGVARLLMQGRQTAVTPRAGSLNAAAKDIADLAKIDIKLACLLLDEAAAPQVMLGPAEKEAALDEISRASTDAYENGRLTAAAAIGWRAATLDSERSKRRQARARLGGDPVIQDIETTPWPDPVTDLGALLDVAVKEVKRFLIAPDAYYDVIALWCLHTHLVPRKELGVDYTPRLGFQSPKERCGKSTGLKCTLLMSHNPRPGASLTPSSVFRAVDASAISIMVEEGDNVFKNANPELLAVMNAGADRMLAKVMRTEKTDDGKFVPREFNCFAAVAFTSIKQVTKTLQDRSIVLQMKRATKGERPKKLTVRTRGGLIDIRRKFMRWATDLSELPDPKLPPDLFNRIEDRWFVLFQIAGLAGGDWPERCHKAALADFAREEADAVDGGPNGDLLGDVWEVFHASKKVQMFTKDILAALLAQSESPWTTINHGQPANEYYLRTNLRDFLPDNAEKIAPRKWREGIVQARGFHQLHFKDAFERYLGKGLPCPSEEQNQTAQSAADEDPPQQGPIRSPSHPSHPSADGDRSIVSKCYDGMDAPDGSVRSSIPKGETGSKMNDGTDGGTEANDLSDPHNSWKNQSLDGKKDGWVGWDGYSKGA
ncbi:MAG TPA: DUF3631 domain-containing protein [Roseiarcus sp.]|jgi:hypothetical protein|nr:DUF3631 domain-containing protein [Roseiarcus sp.]